MEHELSTARHDWLSDRQKLIEQKDAERRKTLEELQDQNEKDYREFLSEHQNTLDKALKAAREQFSREKVCNFHTKIFRTHFKPCVHLAVKKYL